MRILITGGSGFIGSHLAERLTTLGHAVTTLDLRPGPKNPDIRFMQGDIRDREAMEKAVKGQDAVCHLAAMVGVERCLRHPDEVYDVNYNGVKTLMEVCAVNHVSRIFFASSSEVYGEGTGRGLLRESDPLLPRSVYGKAKCQAEQYLRSFSGQSNLRISIGRYCNIYGERQDTAFVIPAFIQCALSGQPLTICGTGDQTRNFTYVSDAIEGTIAALFRQSVPYDIFNISSSYTTTIRALAQKILTIHKDPVGLEFISFAQRQRDPAVEILQRNPCTEKAAQILGFKAAVALEEGLERTYRFYKHSAQKEASAKNAW